MAEINTRADSLRYFNTGASADGNAQTDPNLSLGKFRSSTRTVPLTVAVQNPISNITVDFVAGANGTGNGTLTATGVNDLKWTPPGGTQGVAVTITNGQTKILEGGGTDPQKYIQVTRTSATDLTGTATLVLTTTLNNAAGFDDVSSAEASAGDIEYRCIALKNGSSATVKSAKVKVSTLATQRVSAVAQLPASGAGTIETTGASDFADWPATGFVLIKTNAPALREIAYYSSRTDKILTVPAAGRALLGTSAAAGAATDTLDSIPGIGIGLDAPTSQSTGSFEDQTGVGEGTAPAGVSFSTPITDADALSIGDLSTGNIYGIWIKRQVSVGKVAALGEINRYDVNFDAA